MVFSPVRRLGSAVLVVFAMSASAYAQTPAKPSPEHIALARAVVAFTGARDSFDDVVPKLLTDARNNILRTQPNLQPDLDPAAVEVAKQLRNADEDLANKIAEVYASKFTEAELKEIAGFYQSPAGQKMKALLPEIMGETYKHVQEFARKMSVDIMTQLRAEMKKRGHDI